MDIIQERFPMGKSGDRNWWPYIILLGFVLLVGSWFFFRKKDRLPAIKPKAEPLPPIAQKSDPEPASQIPVDTAAPEKSPVTEPKLTTPDPALDEPSNKLQ